MTIDTAKLEHVYDQIIKQIVSIYPKVDRMLVKAVIKHESAFNPVAQSPVGARGLMQTMPTTDKWIDGEDDGFDVLGNINDGCKYLQYLYDFWNLRGYSHELLMQLVIASYNAGQGNILKATAQAEVDEQPKTWGGIAAVLHKVTGPRSLETIQYVERVMSSWKAYVEKGGRG